MPFITRAYNRIAVNPGNRTITKTSDTDRLRNEIEYYQKLPKELEIYFPRYIASQTATKPYSLELEYYAYQNLGQHLTECCHGVVFWKAVMKMLFDSVEDFKQVKPQGLFEAGVERQAVRQCVQSMLIDKTKNEYEKLKASSAFFYNLRETGVTVNDEYCHAFEEIWPTVEAFLIEHFRTKGSINFIHGDLCFSNILVGYDADLPNVTMKFIDPRGSFGSFCNYGLSEYDFGKIYHSLDVGYEFLIYDRFTLTQEGAFEFELAYDESHSCSNKADALEIFHNAFSTDDIYVYKIIQGLIYVGMCARHYDNTERQKAMYLLGLRSLNQGIHYFRKIP